MNIYSGHKTEGFKRKLALANTDVVHIPGGLTPLAQPLDVVVNKPFKDSLCYHYHQWLLEQVESAHNPEAAMEAPTRQQLSGWIVAAWNEFPEEILRTSFTSCGISNKLDGSEDHLMHVQIPQNDDCDDEDGLTLQAEEDDQEEETNDELRD